MKTASAAGNQACRDNRKFFWRDGSISIIESQPRMGMARRGEPL